MVALVLPPLAMAWDEPLREVLICGAIVDGIVIGWLAAVATPAVSFLEWLACSAVLISTAAGSIISRRQTSYR